jgi:putative nucleotidyltransferase with HDIG domain
MKPSINDVVRNAEDLPSLPAIFQQVCEIVKNPKSSVQDVASYINKDQAFTARLLKVVNGSFYGFSQRIETTTEALNMIGMREAMDLVLGTSVISAFKNLSVDLVSPASFWKHSLGVAIASSILATECGDSNPERFFTGGLLHDIGRLIMYIKLPDETSKVFDKIKETGLEDIEIENEVMGFNHCEVGGALLEKWKISNAVIEMVRYHHQPSSAKKAPMEANIVHIADFIVTGLEIGSSGELLVPTLCSDFWEKNLVSITDIERFIEDVETQTDEMAGVFLGMV